MSIPHILIHAAVWLYAFADAAPTLAPPHLSIPRGEVPSDVSPTPERVAPKEHR